MAVNIGPKIGIDGEAEYRKQIQGIIQETRTLKSEYEKISSSVDKSTASFKQNKAMHETLTKEIEAQTRKVDELSKMVKASADKYGETDTKTQKWKESLNKATTELNQMKSELKGLPSQVELLGDKFKTAGEHIKDWGGKIEDLGSKLAPLSTAAAGVLGGSAKAAIDFESAFTGVQKTVDATDEEFKELSDWIKEASTQMASSKTDIAGTMEIAGQLGVSGVANLEAFTKTMIMLGDTTNLSSEDASSSLAKFMNITGESTSDVDRIGSAIVDLGNNFATTEADIVEMSTRLASAGTIAGLSSADILALSTAMSSAGINAEAGGTAMSQTLKKIAMAVDQGGENLDTYAEVAGVSANKFATVWKNEPVKAVEMFIGGLGRLNEEDESVIAVLDDLGLTGIRQSNMLQALALSTDTLTSAVQTANTAYAENDALQIEFDKRMEDTAAKLTNAKEKITNVAIEIGDRLLPYVDKGVDLLNKVISAWDELDPDTQDMIIKATAIAAALAPVLTIGGKIVSGIGGLVSGIGMLASPVGLAVLAAAAVVAAGVAIYENWDTIKAKAAELKDKAVTHLTAMKDGAVLAWDNLKENTSKKWENVKSTVTTHADAMKKGAVLAWENMVKDAHDKFEELKKKITDPIKNAWEFVTGKIKDIWDDIKGLGEKISEFEISFPDIKMPHFNVKWTDYGKFSLPSINVDWYAKAMENGIRMTSPTVFGVNGNSLMAGGEVGAEWVIGESSLMNMIRSAVASQRSNGNVSVGDTTIIINAADGQDVEEIAERVDEIITSRMQALEAAWA